MRCKAVCLSLSLALFSTTAFATQPAPGDVASADPAAEAAYREAMATYETRMQAARSKMLPVFLTLRESAAPRDWMLASQMHVLSHGDDDDPAVSRAARAELLRNAAAAAPDDTLVQWIAMMAMPRGVDGGCAAPLALPANLDNVLRLEPDNGLAWLPVLHKAQQDKDELGIDSALARMAAAERYDDHVIEYARVLNDLYRRYPDAAWIPGNPDDGSTGDASGMLAMATASTASPSLSAVREVCDRAEQPQADARRFAVCADLGDRLLQRAKNLTLRSDGAALLAAAGLPAGETETQEREQAWLAFALWEGDPEQNLRQFSAALLRTGDELEALRDVARARGIALTPPPLWQPPEWTEETDLSASDAETPADGETGD